jgi:hypothetical protein
MPMNAEAVEVKAYTGVKEEVPKRITRKNESKSIGNSTEGQIDICPGAFRLRISSMKNTQRGCWKIP